MKYKNFLSLVVFFILLLPTVSFAQFKPLVGIPGVDGNADFNTYINALYALSISIAALLAVIKIIIAGVKWMISDVVTSKQEAKSDMTGALLGLLIVILAVLILNVINPQLTQTTLFLAPVDAVPAQNGAPAGTPGAPGAPAVVLPQATANCIEKIDPATGVRTYDCAPANADCSSKGGRASAYKNWLGVPQVNKITCSYGTETVVNCEPIPLANPLAAPEYECTAAKAQCAKSGGSVAQEKGSSFTCIVPYVDVM